MGAEIFTRQEPCSFCGERSAERLGRVQYWDLAFADVARCERCHLAQLDPMLKDSAMKSGAEACYALSRASESARSVRRGRLRSFRKGLALGLRFRLRGWRVQRVLELGCGDGYFLKGFQLAVGAAEAVALDLSSSVLAEVKSLHGFAGLLATPESLDQRADLAASFDVVIARDILEHLSDPLRALRAIRHVLRPGGRLHFITPNGREDVWGIHVNWTLRHTPSEMLLNHVNYFDPVGLEAKLRAEGFAVEEYFLYGGKWTKRGRGWKLAPELAAPPAQARSVLYAMELPSREPEGARPPVGFSWAKALWSVKDYWPIVRRSAREAKGHEIWGIVRKLEGGDAAKRDRADKE